LKEENLGDDMAVDEKQVDKEMFTLLSNRTSEKIALMAETLKVNELLSRSRYLLFKIEKDWTDWQKKRAVLLFKTYPALEKDYRLVISFRDWYDKSNIGKETSVITQQLTAWYKQADTGASDELKNVKERMEEHQAKIIPYFKDGKTLKILPTGFSLSFSPTTE
jgi:hypothetical protein